MRLSDLPRKLLTVDGHPFKMDTKETYEQWKERYQRSKVFYLTATYKPGNIRAAYVRDTGVKTEALVEEHDCWKNSEEECASRLLTAIQRYL